MVKPQKGTLAFGRVEYRKVPGRPGWISPRSLNQAMISARRLRGQDSQNARRCGAVGECPVVTEPAHHTYL